jgi:hypothetical protein
LSLKLKSSASKYKASKYKKVGSPTRGLTMITNIKRLVVAFFVVSFASPAMAAIVQLDFNHDFSNQLDPGSELPDGPDPWMTAVFDDGGLAGSVTLTVSVAGTVGAAEVWSVYLNSAVGGLSFTTVDDSAVTSSSIVYGSNAYQAGSDGEFDILIDLPPPGGNRFTAGESIIYNITGTGITASTFWLQSNPTESSVTGPFYGAAKFLSTGECVEVNEECIYENSAWVAAVPVPAAVWLFGSALAGLGWMRRKQIV